MFDIDLFLRSRAYIETNATPHDALAAACSLNEAALAAIERAGGLPEPTYIVFDDGVRSPIRSLGSAPETGGRAYYNPSVLGWVRRAALYGERTLPRLQDWFVQSFVDALKAQAADARRYAWAHLFAAHGALDACAVHAELERLNAEWLRGGWAVCLRQWNGHHVVTKDLERARIGALTEGRDTLSDEERVALFDAIERLDAVMMPFAPYERPHGTPGLFIDAIRAKFGV